MLDAGCRPAEQDVERIASEVLALMVFLQQQQVTLYKIVELVCEPALPHNDSSTTLLCTCVTEAPHITFV